LQVDSGLEVAPTSLADHNNIGASGGSCAAGLLAGRPKFRGEAKQKTGTVARPGLDGRAALPRRRGFDGGAAAPS